jgi:hypothetical protein
MLLPMLVVIILTIIVLNVLTIATIQISGEKDTGAGQVHYFMLSMLICCWVFTTMDWPNNLLYIDSIYNIVFTALIISHMLALSIVVSNSPFLKRLEAYKSNNNSNQNKEIRSAIIIYRIISTLAFVAIMICHSVLKYT